jgi:hypothetical protein
MRRHEFLSHLHRLVAPRNYLEIGVSDGRSLTLAGVPAIGIDPAPKVKAPLGPDAKVVRATSDTFFARADPLEHLRNEPRSVRDRLLGRAPVARAHGSATLDLAFIDGMHLLEFALRDFMNVERHASWTSVIVFDDVLPRDVDEAARDRHTKFWAGDVYKIIEVLRRYRPDLVILPVDTAPTGTLVVIGGDPANQVLRTAYDEIVRTSVVPDPQAVPEYVLARRDAVAPERVVEAGVWPDLIRGREGRVDRAIGYDRIREELQSLMP